MVILGDARTPWVYLLNEVAHPGRKNRPWPHPVRLQTLPPSSNKEINMRYWEPLNCSLAECLDPPLVNCGVIQGSVLEEVPFWKAVALAKLNIERDVMAVFSKFDSRNNL